MVKEEKSIFRSKMKASVLKGVTEIIYPLVGEARFNITPKGISINAVDAAHVGLAYVERLMLLLHASNLNNQEIE